MCVSFVSAASTDRKRKPPISRHNGEQGTKERRRGCWLHCTLASLRGVGNVSPIPGISFSQYPCVKWAPWLTKQPSVLPSVPLQVEELQQCNLRKGKKKSCFGVFTLFFWEICGGVDCFGIPNMPRKSRNPANYVVPLSSLSLSVERTLSLSFRVRRLTLLSAISRGGQIKICIKTLRDYL